MRMSGLEELKSREREVDFLLGGTRFREDWDWLIQQAERVHELEQQNKRYREALKFYAERDNYEPKHFDPNINNYMSTIDYDEGKKAIKALECEE